MIIYADITLLNNFFMTIAIIWATANIMEIKYSWFRLFLGANIANLYLLVVFILQQYRFYFFINFILHISLNIITAILILKISFPGLQRTRFIKALGNLYLITFIGMGTTLSIFYVYGDSPFNTGFLKIIIGLLVLYLLGNTGWKIIQRYKLPDEFYLPTVIYCQNKEVSLTGLLDTGNSLSDPISNLPVIIVNLATLIPIFPEEMQAEMMTGEVCEMDLVEVFQKNNLAHRIRLLPFSDLGEEKGLLLGFRPDLVELFYKGELIRVEKCVIGISTRMLDLDNCYQALIHPKLLNVEQI
ncbi:MAG: sigma-E processing peptidase SpoIIGA [Halanaerobiaceae bacterium]|nr:sigma-E processing peptidase SpoIIGA [Halanaerobiaceae bacterium]